MDKPIYLKVAVNWSCMKHNMMNFNMFWRKTYTITLYGL